MSNPVIPIQCANSTCQASNPLDHQYCHKCNTPIVRRYLWALGDWIKVYQVDELIEERYLLKYPRILLDTKPGIPPEAPEEIPAQLLPYLKLFPQRLHVPQIYSYLPSPDEQMNLEVWLLEYGSIPLNESGDLEYGEAFLPELSQIWQEASPLRQLHWLWQIANLWQPLQSKGVVSSLLNTSLIRVNGNLIQLLELQSDPNQVPTLKQLGKVWSRLIPTVDPTLTDYLAQLCDRLEQGKIKTADQLISLLDQMLNLWGKTYQRTYQIYTATDTGLTREHNEDACYPPHGQLTEIEQGQPVLTIVCDGIGGQDGGEIASKLAIDTLVDQFSKILLTSHPPETSSAYSQSLAQTINTTNDRISQRNDSENRQERQRMGTTLVMGLSHHHEIYFAHVGDSRIYWITPQSCHQITVDDDLASREVRLGYLLYRDAIQYPNAGALVQALGMSKSTVLHPTVQRWILDEDAVFLLCSDGLSDYERVEQYWQTAILPLLDGKTDIETLGKQLIEIANQQNGHDNVTISLIYCRVQLKVGEEINAVPFSTLEKMIGQQALANPPLVDPATQDYTATTTEETLTAPLAPSTPQPQPPSLTSPSPPETTLQTRKGWWLLLPIGILLAIGAGYWIWQQQQQSEEESVPPPVSVSPSPLPPSVAANTLITLQKPLPLSPPSTSGVDAIETAVTLPANSILKVQPLGDNETLLGLQVCQLPQTAENSSLKATLGKIGIIAANDLLPDKYTLIKDEETQVSSEGRTFCAGAIAPLIQPPPSNP